MDNELRNWIDEAICKAKDAKAAGVSFMIRHNDAEVLIMSANTASEIEAIGEAWSGGYVVGEEE